MVRNSIANEPARLINDPRQRISTGKGSAAYGRRNDGNLNLLVSEAFVGFDRSAGSPDLVGSVMVMPDEAEEAATAFYADLWAPQTDLGQQITECHESNASTRLGNVL